MKDEFVLQCGTCDLVTKFVFVGPSPALANTMRAKHRKHSPNCPSTTLRLKLSREADK